MVKLSGDVCEVQIKLRKLVRSVNSNVRQTLLETDLQDMSSYELPIWPTKKSVNSYV